MQNQFSQPRMARRFKFQHRVIFNGPEVFLMIGFFWLQTCRRLTPEAAITQDF